MIDPGYPFRLIPRWKRLAGVFFKLYATSQVRKIFCVFHAASMVRQMNRNFFSRWRWEFAMAGAVVVTAGILVVSELGYKYKSDALANIIAAEENSREILNLLSNVLFANVARRDYLFTRREDSLESYEASKKKSKTILSSLIQRYQTSSDGDGLEQLGKIATLAGEYYVTLDMTISRVREGNVDAAMELFNSDAGRQKIRMLHQAVHLLLEYNLERVRIVHGRSVDAIKFSRIGVASVTGVNIALLCMLFGRLGIELRKKETESTILKEQQELLDAQVRERTRQLEFLAAHLQDLIEGEKERLARELHDELGSILTAAKMDVAWVRGRLDNNAGGLEEKLERTLKYLDQGILVKRRLIEDLLPSTLSSFGLIVAARELAEENASRNEWQLELELPEAEPTIEPDTATTLYRILQEALHNATKYAQAKYVRVQLTCTDQELSLEITDDGVGFRLHDVRPNALGLVGMRQRVLARSGKFEIFSSPNEGCRIRVILPLKRREQCVPGPDSHAASPSLSRDA
jgi:signal transduction histidine kinase